MSLRRAFLAAALFLAAVCANTYLPTFGEKVLPAVREMIDRDSLTLPLPEEAMAWLASR